LLPALPAFPANREFYREFPKIRRFGHLRDCKKRRRCWAFKHNSLLNRTGNYFGETGNPAAGTGKFFGLNLKSKPNEIFGRMGVPTISAVTPITNKRERVWNVR
jgi:hypothetical protein